MRYDEVDARMRVFESSYDHRILPGLFVVARVDGRNFTRLTRERHAFEAPYDGRFRDLMLETTRHLMNCGFRTVFAYTQSDEISLLFHPDEANFSRKERKFLSILAGEASARFSLSLGDIAAFDARLSLLPAVNLVIDYFRWRMEDAGRNCLNGYCYWTMRKRGMDAESATREAKGLGNSRKHDLLFDAGINFNDLPTWQKRGIGVYWRDVERRGVDPRTGAEVATTRRQLFTDLDLPRGEDFDALLRRLLPADPPVTEEAKSATSIVAH